MHSLNTISNNRIKEIVKLHQKKYRDESNLFIAEGEKALQEALISNIEIIEIYALKSFDSSNIKKEICIIPENIMKKIATTDSPCEVLFIAKKKKYNKENFSILNKIALIDSISDCYEVLRAKFPDEKIYKSDKPIVSIYILKEQLNEIQDWK